MAQQSFELGALVAACRDLAKRSGTLISTIYEKGDLQVVEKMYGENRKCQSLKDIMNVQDPTTVADEMAQKLIIGSLQKVFPDLNVCGEEGDLKVEESEIVTPNTTFDMKIPAQYQDIKIEDLVVWVDPIDGTKEFTEGIKSAVTTLIGIAHKGRPIAGIIGRPFTGEVIWGVVGLGAFGFKNKDKLSTRNHSSRIICTSRSHFKPSMKAYVSACSPTGFVRAGGSGGKVLMVIEGDADSYVFPSLGTKKWDTCAPEAVLLALGGKLTKPDGTLYDYDPANCKPMNAEGFIATVFGDEYHASYLEENLTIFQLDLILFGATGFTGKLAVDYIVEHYIYSKKEREEKEKTLNFGIAGRDMVKLQNVLKNVMEDSRYQDIAQEIETRVKLIECDCFDTKSVESMVQKTSAVVTTVGPYAKYGENLIAACCKYGVDYVDLTGEFHWVKRMMNKYDSEAKRSHARIVNFGGCVAALTDCVIYCGVKQLMEKDENASIKSITPFHKISGKATASGGTMGSYINAMSDGNAMRIDQHDAYFLCESEDYKWQTANKQPKYRVIEAEYKTQFGAYAIPFIYGPLERMVFMRSNELLNYFYGAEVKIFENLMLTNNGFFAWVISFFSWLVPILLKYTIFRSCIIKLVKSFAPSSGQGPDEKAMKEAKWRETVEIKASNKMMCTVETTIYGDYGYLNTAKLMVEQGVLCSLERSNPKIRKIKGGFLTPAAAFKEKLPMRMSKLKEFDISYKVDKDNE